MYEIRVKRKVSAIFSDAFAFYRSGKIFSLIQKTSNGTNDSEQKYKLWIFQSSSSEEYNAEGRIIKC